MRLTWSMITPKRRMPVPVLPEYVTVVTDALVASDFVLIRSAWSLYMDARSAKYWKDDKWNRNLFVITLSDIVIFETAAPLEIEPLKKVTGE